MAAPDGYVLYLVLIGNHDYAYARNAEDRGDAIRLEMPRGVSADPLSRPVAVW